MPPLHLQPPTLCLLLPLPSIAIHCWLSKIDTLESDGRAQRLSPTPTRKRRRPLDDRGDMDATRRTTPLTSASRSSSPSKKRKIDDGTFEQAAWAVPPLQPSARTTLPHPSSIHSSSGASLPSSSHSALPSTNPPSTASDRQARVPTSQTSRRCASLISEGRLPLDITFREPAADPETGPYEGNIDSDDEYNHLPLLALASGVPSSRQAHIAYGEFYRVRTIKRCARKCLALRLSEAEWNSDVHKPLLNLALTTWSGDASVACQNVTSARILPCFLPFTSTGDVAEGKMVDFVLSPKIPNDSELDMAIRDALRARAVQQQQSPASNAAHHCVNQTDYPVLSRAPIAVTIETKVAGANLDEGRLQLGIWTAAWHYRMRMLGVGGDAGGPPLPTLPLILTWDHEWKLFFAIDRVHRIEIFGPLQIGRRTISPIHISCSPFSVFLRVGSTLRLWLG
ncbi:hypothetical protein B0T18DRAFT_460916 [Schizothecium vesticola]|uniref:PD-(D/E)XK nuclease-like domain-containing protein n=1 Tax=Schizothecium vesticola TaxID=314040 RepID=A0AA40K857_9PEZI|nr:hypothetical protein B0T18DRAFT_460916 [Schizothecium vesticola]